MRVIIEPDYQSLSNWAANYKQTKSMLLNQQKKNRLFSDFLPVLHLLVCTKH